MLAMFSALISSDIFSFIRKIMKSHCDSLDHYFKFLGTIKYKYKLRMNKNNYEAVKPFLKVNLFWEINFNNLLLEMFAVK